MTMHLNLIIVADGGKVNESYQSPPFSALVLKFGIKKEKRSFKLFPESLTAGEKISDCH